MNIRLVVTFAASGCLFSSPVISLLPSHTCRNYQSTFYESCRLLGFAHDSVEVRIGPSLRWAALAFAKLGELGEMKGAIGEYLVQIVAGFHMPSDLEACAVATR